MFQETRNWEDQVHQVILEYPGRKVKKVSEVWTEYQVDQDPKEILVVVATNVGPEYRDQKATVA